jgi:hypothetical protein
MRLGLLLVALFAARIAAACQCPLSTAAADYQRADVVFGGRVTAIDEPVQTGTSGTQRVTFEDTRVWKGAASTRILLLGGNACAATFRSGHAYVVFAQRLASGDLMALPCAIAPPLVCANYFGLLPALGIRDGDAPASGEPYPLPEANCVKPPVLVRGKDLGRIIQYRQLRVDLLVDREGKVARFAFSPGAVACHECTSEDRREVERIVRTWRFRPATLNGRPVAVQIGYLDFNFPKRMQPR